MKYSVEFRPAVLKSLKRLPKKDLRRIKKRIDDFSENLPDPATTKMKGNKSFHKIQPKECAVYIAMKDYNFVKLYWCRCCIRILSQHSVDCLQSKIGDHCTIKLWFLKHGSVGHSLQIHWLQQIQGLVVEQVLLMSIRIP